MSNYLFAYGTLQPEHVPGEVASDVARLRSVGTGYVHGTLYDLGEYPGAILDPSSRRRVFGTVFRLSDNEDLLSRLDAYEGFDPANPDVSLFVRTLHPVRLTTGRTLKCWLYAYNRTPKSAPILAGGRYRKSRRPAPVGVGASARRSGRRG